MISSMIYPYCILFLILLLCHQGLSVNHGQNLVWSQKDAYGVARIVAITGDPSDWITTRKANTKYITAPSTHWHFRALAYQYNAKTLFWSDIGNKNIQGLVLNGSTSAITIADSISAHVDGMAVDWINNNFYWTDSLYDWIVIQSLSNHGKWRILHTTGLDKPQGIAVHPAKGYLYWTDFGDVPKIEVSLLNGEERRILVDSRITHPRGITVDCANDRVYWVDAGRDTIESVDLHGNDRTQHFMMPGSNFIGIAVYKTYIFVTDQAVGQLRIFDTASARNLNFKLGANPYSVLMYDEGNQKHANSSCADYGCEHICVALPNRTECLCDEGTTLSTDLKSCESSSDLDTRRPAFILSIGDSICLLPVLLPTMKAVNNTLRLNEECVVKGVKGLTSLDFNWKQRMVFYYDAAAGTISRTRLSTGHMTDKVVEGNTLITDFTVDWVSSYIYWADLQSTPPCIVVAKDDGTAQKKLICGEGFQPTAIVVDPIGRTLYWVNEQNKTLEKSLLDGSKRETVLRFHRISNITRLRIDFKIRRIFWTDAAQGVIQSISMSGGGRTLEFAKHGSNMVGLAFYRDFMVWTDNGDTNGVYAAVKGSTEILRSLKQPDDAQTGDIVTLAAEYQPDIFDNPCDINGTICQELCFPMDPVNFTCACGNGVSLSDDGRCYADLDMDKFLLVTDTSMKKIFLIDLDTNNATGLPLEAHENPIAIDYNWREKRIYWTDVEKGVIKRAFVNASNEEVFWHLGSASSITDGLAVDSTTGLVYYTDAGLKEIAVINSKGTYHKVLLNSNIDQPRAIVANASHGYFYWTDWGNSARIERAQMDGSHREQLVSTGLSTWPNALAVDFAENKLYWCEARHNTIHSFDLINRNKSRIYRSFVSHFFGMSILGDYLYITDWTQSQILRINKTSSKVKLIGEPVFGRLNDIHAYHISQTFDDFNACDNNGGCEQLCLPKPAGRIICACDDAFTLLPDGKNCKLTTATPLSTTSATTRQTTTITAATTTPVVTTINTTTKKATTTTKQTTTGARSTPTPTTTTTTTTTVETTPPALPTRTNRQWTTTKSTQATTSTPKPIQTTVYPTDNIPTKKTLKPVKDDDQNKISPGKSAPSSQSGGSDSLRNYIIVGIVAAAIVLVTLAFLVAFLVQRKCKNRKLQLGSISHRLTPNEEGPWTDEGNLMVQMEDRSSRGYDTLVDDHDNLDTITYDDNHQLLST